MDELETLGERLRLGDKGVIPTIITILAPAVTATVRRAAKGKYSEDIAQDALLHLTGALSRLQLDNNNIKLWVLTKAYYLALQYLRQYTRGDFPCCDITLFEEKLARTYSQECEAREIIEKVLEEMEDSQTTEVVRLYMEDYTFQEIAAKVGRTKGQVFYDYQKFGRRCKQLIGA